MEIKQGQTVGKEQLILLPVEQMSFTLTTDPGVQVVMQTGRNAIVVSGYVETGFFISPTADDDDIFEFELHFLVGPFWTDIVQVSASVSLAGISSMESDEVDHSRWEIQECNWEVADLPPDGEKIRLKVKFKVQGAFNGLGQMAYQVVSTGTLSRMPTPDEISANLS
jgi:hypothetical protein